MKKHALPQYDILQAYALENNYLDEDDLQIAIAEMNSQLDEEFSDSLKLCDLHKRRLKYLAELIRLSHQESILGYFSAYLHGVTEIAKTSPNPPGIDFFNSKIVVEDFQRILNSLKKNQALMEIIAALSSYAPIDKLASWPLPHGSQWELLFANRLQTEIPTDPAKANEFLSRIRFFTNGGHLATLRAKLFKDAYEYAMINQDIAYFRAATPTLIEYLFSSGQLQQLGNLPWKLMLSLLAKAQNRSQDAFLFLCQFAQQAINNNSLALVEKLLTAIVKPKAQGDNDQNYYSTYAMGYLLSYVLNITRFIAHPQGMSELQASFYRQSLEFYFSDYFQALNRQGQNHDFGFICELLRLFDLARRELRDIDEFRKMIRNSFRVAFQHRLSLNVVSGAKQALEVGDVNIFKLGELFVANLLECLSYRDLVGLLIQLFSFAQDSRVSAEQLMRADPIYAAIFTALVSPKRPNETDKIYDQRIASIIMLYYQYGLSENVWKHFFTLMRNEVKLPEKLDQFSLGNMIGLCPGDFCQATVLVLDQYKLFFPNKHPSADFIVACIYAWAEANYMSTIHRLAPLSVDLRHKIAALISRSTEAVFEMVLSLPKHCLERIAIEYSDEVIMRSCDFIALSMNKVHAFNATQQFIIFIEILLENKRYSLLQQFLTVAYKHNLRLFVPLLEKLLNDFSPDEETILFVFSYVSDLPEHGKQVFRRCLEEILHKVPGHFWSNTNLEWYLPVLFAELCVAKTHHHNALNRLLDLGANPFAEVNESCAFIDAIKCYGNNNGVLELLCEYILSNQVSVDFQTVYKICPDPLGLATRHEVPAQTIELMIRIGFDVNKYQFSIHQQQGHELIAKQQKQDKAQNGNRRASFGFFKPKTDDDIPALFIDEVTFEVFVDPVFCTLDRRTYENNYIRHWLSTKGHMPGNTNLVLFTKAELPPEDQPNARREFIERRINSVIFENSQLKNAIKEYKAANKHLFDSDEDDDEFLRNGQNNNN